MADKPKVIIYKESLAQSLISDVATFGFILLCIWASQGSTWWTFITGCMLLFFVVVRAAIATKSGFYVRLYSLDEIQAWLDRERLADGNE